MKINPTRLKILETSQNLMMRQGFHGVTVDQIIAEAGISKGSFFYHFKSKDELPAALLDNFLSCQAEAFQTVMHSTDTANPLENALSVVCGVGEIFAVTTMGKPGCVMAAFSYQMLDYPDVQTTSQKAIQGWEQAFNRYFQPLCDTVSGAPDGVTLARQLLFSLQGATIVARIEGNDNAVRQSTEVFCDYLRRLFVPSKV